MDIIEAEEQYENKEKAKMSSRNKWLYSDFLEEVVGLPEQAEIIRALPLVDWDRLEPRALEFMADRRAAGSRARAAERTRRWRLKKTEESRARVVGEQRLTKASQPPTPTGDPNVDAARRRLADQP